MINKEIAILLSTYNGADYIEEQINSIINQTNSNWILYIRDDGSEDKTIEILSKYEKLNPNIILLKSDQINLGAKESFLWLMKNTESDYYMFCDQDDVWLPNKIEVTFNEFIKLQDSSCKSKALLVFTNLFVVDNNLNLISDSMWEYNRTNRIMEPLKYLYITPLATGCTMLFNNKAKTESLKYTQNALMHDSLLALTVVATGGIAKAVSESTIYYRQHQSNVYGTQAFNNSFIYRISNIKSIINSYLKYYSFVRSVNNITWYKFIVLKIEVFFKIRNLI
jgi:glycosyltransferase involved in cell wall biosynthesis